MEIEKKLWDKVNKYVPKLAWIPFVRLVAVCNNLAFGMVKEGSDIDLFIIAKKNRLFIVRFFVTAYLHFLGVRRHSKMVNDRFCLSFFIDDSYLNLAQVAKKNDVYLAYWIKNIVPVIDDGVSEEFLLVNDWIKDFFEKEEKMELFYGRRITLNVSKLMEFLEWIFNGVFGNFIEYLLRKWQLHRARKKAGTINSGGLMVEEHILKFHNVDCREEYRDAWIKKYGDSKLTKAKFLNLF